MNFVSRSNRNLILPLVLLPVWFLIYHFLKPVTDWFVDDILGMTAGTHLTETLRFFIFEVPKVLLLLTLIIPQIAIVIPMFKLFAFVKLLNTHVAIILPSIMSVFIIFFMRQNL